MIEDQQLWKSEDGEDRKDWSELLAEKKKMLEQMGSLSAERKKQLPAKCPPKTSPFTSPPRSLLANPYLRHSGQECHNSEDTPSWPGCNSPHRSPPSRHTL